MTDKLTQELETAVERGLGQNSAQQRMTGGARNGNAPVMGVLGGKPAPLADMLSAVAQHNENVKAQLDQAIRDLQDLREKL